MPGRKRACEPKPPWLRLLCPPGNTSRLEADVCGGCSHWIIRCKQGVWESYDPGIIQGDDIAVAIILGRRLIRLDPVPGTGAPRIIDVWGARGIKPDGRYLGAHTCGLAPVSKRPYKPPKRQQRCAAWHGPRLTEQEIQEFARIWNTTTGRTE